MCDTCRPLDKPIIQLPPTTRHITDLNILDLDVNIIPLWSKASQTHYEKNTHHPEHFTDPSQMDELSRKHMLCALLASFWGTQRKNNYFDNWTIPKVAHKCKDWPEWKYVQDLYKGSYEESPELLPHIRWNTSLFLDEKVTFKIFVKCFLRNKISKKEFIEGLYAFQSVQDYIEDLRWQQQTIVDVGKELFPDDEALHAALATHDDDKWDALMVAAYVLKWIFEEEILQLDDRFDTKCNPCMIYNILERGKEEMKRLLKENVKLDTEKREKEPSTEDDRPAKLMKTEE